MTCSRWSSMAASCSYALWLGRPLPPRFARPECAASCRGLGRGLPPAVPRLIAIWPITPTVLNHHRGVFDSIVA
jgi:hypothetical protein